MSNTIPQPTGVCRHFPLAMRVIRERPSGAIVAICADRDVQATLDRLPTLSIFRPHVLAESSPPWWRPLGSPRRLIRVGGSEGHLIAVVDKTRVLAIGPDLIASDLTLDADVLAAMSVPTYVDQVVRRLRRAPPWWWWAWLWGGATTVEYTVERIHGVSRFKYRWIDAQLEDVARTMAIDIRKIVAHPGATVGVDADVLRVLTMCAAGAVRIDSDAGPAGMSPFALLFRDVVVGDNPRVPEAAPAWLVAVGNLVRAHPPESFPNER